MTLIETIAAIVILVIAVPAMLWTLSEAHQQRVDPVMTSRACWLAMEKMEDVIADRYSPMRGYAYLVEANYEEENPVDEFPGFSRRVSFELTGPDLASPGGAYTIATVTVEWIGSRGESRSFSLSTVFTDLSDS